MWGLWWAAKWRNEQLWVPLYLKATGADRSTVACLVFPSNNHSEAISRPSAPTSRA